MHRCLDYVLPQYVERFGHFLSGHNFIPLPINHLPLIVRNIVILEELLANIKVACLNLSLGTLNRRGYYPRLDRYSRLAQTLHHSAHSIGGEYAHQIILKRQVKPRESRISLTPCTASELIVDTPTFMPLGANHMKTACLQH